MKTLLIIIALTAFNTYSQDSLIQYIDSTRYEYDSIIKLSQEEGMDFFPPRFTTESTLMERAIGEVKTTTTIYFDKHELESENFDIPKDYGTIRKVDISIQSVSYLITKTFYFSEKGVLKYYSYEEEGYEKTYYFQSNLCIQITQHSLLTDDCDPDTELENYIKTEISDSDKRRITFITKKAGVYTSLLKVYYESLRY